MDDRQNVGRMLGSGAPPGDPATTRSMRVHLAVRPGEFEDLEAIAEAWRVPIATVAWAIVADQLARWRKVPLELGPLAIPLIAARQVLERNESEANRLHGVPGSAAAGS